MDTHSIKMFLFYKIKTRKPVTDKDWEIARKEYAKNDKDNKLELTIDLVKEIDKGLGSKTRIRSETLSLFAWAHNILELFKENEIKEEVEKQDKFTDLIDENTDEDTIQMYKALDESNELEAEKRSKWQNIDNKSAINIVTKNGMDLEFLNSTYRKDEGIVFAAVKENGAALRYADESLISDKNIVLAAINNDGGALYYADETFKDNKDIVIKAVKQRGTAIESASENLRKDREVSLYATLSFSSSEECCYALNELVDHTYKKDKAFMLRVVEADGSALYCADDKLRKDKEIVLAAAKNNGSSFMDAHESLKADREFVLEVVKADGFALQFVSEELKKDKDIVLESIKEHWHFIHYADECMKSDADILQAIEVSKQLKQSRNNS